MLKQPRVFSHPVSLALTFPYDTNLPEALESLQALSITIFHGCGYEATEAKFSVSHRQWRFKERRFWGNILEARAWYFIEVLCLTRGI